MPHIVIEYSANLAARIAPALLVQVAHEAALATGVFPLGGTRTRALVSDTYRIADAHPDNAFVHVTLRIGHGRDLDTRRRAGQAVFDALGAALEPVFASSPIGLSLEVTELHPDLNFKRNNLHHHVRERGNGATP